MQSIEKIEKTEKGEKRKEKREKILKRKLSQVLSQILLDQMLVAFVSKHLHEGNKSINATLIQRRS